ncbi:MAG: hypothetical protein WCA32_19240 [Chromatiaceae bacterium]
MREADFSRRIMSRARAENAPPKQLHGGLTGLHERKPFPYSRAEIEQAAAAVKDRNYRIQVNEEGIHVYNVDGLHRATDPFDLYPKPGVETDGRQASYLGVELARAEIAHRVGKRYTQDGPLHRGTALPPSGEHLLTYATPAATNKKAWRG